MPGQPGEARPREIWEGRLPDLRAQPVCRDEEVEGEGAPARLDLEALAARVALPMTLLARFGRPVVWLLRASTNGVLRLLGATRPPASSVSEEEVKAMIAEGTEAGVFHREERRMLERVLRFADQPVRAIMVPRPEVVALPIDAPIEEAIEAVRRARHSRYPLFGSELDDVRGVVHVKDLLALHKAGDGDLASILETPLYVSPNMPALQLLERFRESRVHMAIVVDEYGSLDGILTPLDILSAIAGRLPESVDETPAAVRREDGSWLLG